MEKNNNIELKFYNNNLIISINNIKYKFSLAKISKRLFLANEKNRNNYIISPSGYGIHWPEIDEDISIPALIKSYKKKIHSTKHKTQDNKISDEL